MSFNVGGSNANVNAQQINFTDGSVMTSATLTYTSVYASGTQDMPNDGPYATTLYLSFDTVLTAQGAAMYSASYPTRLTAPQSGIYLYSAGAAFEQLPGANGQLTLQANINSSITPAQSAQQGQTSFNPSNSITTTMFLNAGDYVQINVYQSVGGTVTVFGGSSTYMSLALLIGT